MTLKIAYSLASVLAILLYLGMLLGDWGARTYRRLGADSLAWFWLRQLDVPVNQANCETFLRMVSVGGLVFVVVTNIAVWTIV